MPQLKLASDILAAALVGFQVQKFAIEGKIAEIRRLLDRSTLESADASEPRKKRAAAVTKPRRTMSAAGRKRIAAAQKKRWAAIKKAAQ